MLPLQDATETTGTGKKIRRTAKVTFTETWPQAARATVRRCRMYVDMAIGNAPETAQFVAANGDIIYAVGHGYGVNEGNPPVSATITEWMTITGGTGRFQGVSGSYTIPRTAAISPELTTTQATFEGTMATL